VLLRLQSRFTQNRQPEPGPEAEHDPLVAEVIRLVESGEALDDAIVARLPGWQREDILKALQLAVNQGEIYRDGGSDA
jgi:hypothetical protein